MKPLLLNMKTKKILEMTGVAVLPTVLIVLFSFGLIRWGSVKLEQNRYITVTGTSSEDISNQLATYSVNVESTNANKDIAVKQANDKAQNVVTTVKKFGIQDKDIKTTSVNIFQVQEPYIKNGLQNYRPGDWRETITTEITLRDISKVNGFTDLLSGLDLTNMYGPNFSIDNSSIDDTAFIKSALADARKKALFIALNSGGKLGEIISVIEGSNTSSNPPVVGGLGGGGAAVEPGSQKVTKTVTVTYSLK